MPSFPLTESQISGIVAFLHARIAASDIRSAGKNGSYSLQQLLTGNAASGKAFFEGAGGCVACHSANGDLAAIARRYPPAELQARFLYPAGAQETVTISLPSGNTIEGQLLRLDSFTVAVRDSQGWYHSWPIGSVKVTVHDPLSTHRQLLERYTNAEMHNVFAYLETLK
jgi:cytochrome c oxidase cbb3-type subunit 3